MNDFTESELKQIRLKLAKENKKVSALCKELGFSRNAYYMALKDADRATNVSIAILDWLYDKPKKKGDKKC